MRIALCGKAGSGKDAVADILVRKYGFKKIKMAGGLKKMTAAYLQYLGVGEVVIDRMIEGDLKEVRSHHLGGKSPRVWMQSIGTEFGRDIISKGLWVNGEMSRLGLGSRIVCADVRFDDEAKVLQEHGFACIEKIGGSDSSVGIKGHISERGISAHHIYGQIPWANDPRDSEANVDGFMDAFEQHLCAIHEDYLTMETPSKECTRW